MSDQSAPSVIMHVDDDVDILEIARMALQLVDNFVLHQFDNAEAAIAKAAEIRPDLLLLDFMMPDRSGPDLWASLRGLEGLDATPTIFMTAKAEDEVSLDLVRQGALCVITKPFDPMTLGAEIREAWSKRTI